MRGASSLRPQQRVEAAAGGGGGGGSGSSGGNGGVEVGGPAAGAREGARDPRVACGGGMGSGDGGGGGGGGRWERVRGCLGGKDAAGS